MVKYHSDADRTGWVGMDLDGVLVEWDPRYLPGLGPPIVHGITLTRRLLAAGKEVRIFTARVEPSPDEPAWHEEAARLGFHTADAWIAYQEDLITKFSLEHFHTALRITARKDWRLTAYYDDRAIQMIPNTGESLSETYRRELQGVRAELQQLMDTFDVDDH